MLLKHKALLIFLFTSVYCTAQPDTNTILFTDEYKLSWEDFTGSPQLNSINSANSFTGVDLKMEQKNNSLIINTFSFFKRDKSWVKTESKKESLLRHEQLHFDITELYARKFRKKLVEYKLTIKNVQSKLKPLFQDYLDQLWKEQKKYDRETNHHINTKKQLEWESRIKIELDEYKGFKTSEVQIKLDK